MIYAGISHFADQRDAFFLENGKIRIRLSAAAGDIASVVLHMADKYIPRQKKDTRTSLPMEKCATDFSRDYFAADVDVPVTEAGNPDMLCLRYMFEITDRAGAKVWYGDGRFFASEPEDIEAMFDCPLISRKEQIFLIPDWAKSAVVYQIFPSRFATTEDVPDEQWYKAPISFRDDIRGNLKGITKNLDYLKELGVDVVYMTPIFRANSIHKYDTVDYYQIDPAFGTAEDLHDLIDGAHARGMRVILDGVFNHTSPDFFAFRDVREKGQASEYWDWYYVDHMPIDPGDGGRKPTYQSFAYVGGMPKLNLGNPDAAKYVTDVAVYYLKEFGIDGWRLDVADEIGHSFWKNFRKAVKAVNPDALLVGEVWHFAPDFLMGDEWDSCMNYTFYKSISSMLCDGTTRPSDFLAEQGALIGQYHSAVLPVLWNLIDSHDTSRFLWRAGGDRRKLMLAAAFQMLLPGTPFIYYGDEVGMTGGDDPDNRRGMLWAPERQDMELYRWYQRLTYFRHMVPDIPAGRYDAEKADDARGILEFHLTSGEILLFHTTGGETTAKEYSGYSELLRDRIFDGKLEPYTAVLLKRA